MERSLTVFELFIAWFAGAQLVARWLRPVDRDDIIWRACLLLDEPSLGRSEDEGVCTEPPSVKTATEGRCALRASQAVLGHYQTLTERRGTASVLSTGHGQHTSTLRDSQ